MKMFTAVSLAKEMKLPPKRVRAILRQAGLQHDGRWKFPVDQKARLKETIRNARRRANVAKKSSKAPRRPVTHREVEHRVH